MIRVLVVDDSNTICYGLQQIFVPIVDVDVIAFAYNGIEAIEKVHQENPDIVIIDVIMPLMGGIEATKKIVSRFPKTKVIVNSSFKRLSLISQALEAGAKGYILKDLMPNDIEKAIRSVHQGDLVFPPQIISQLTTLKVEKKVEKKEVDISLDDVTPNLNDRQTIVSKPIALNKKPFFSIKIALYNKLINLFRYGDWTNYFDWIFLILVNLIIFLNTQGINNYFAYSGLFFLVILIGRSSNSWRNLAVRGRIIGILTFVLILAHAIYASVHLFSGQPSVFLSWFITKKLEIALGVLALLLISPIGLSISQKIEKRMQKRGKQIYLSIVTGLCLAVVHTILSIA